MKPYYNELSNDFLLCKTILHAWDEVPAPDLTKPQYGEWYFVLRCTRCATRRIDLISGLGTIVNRRYEYPEDYKLVEKVTRSELRIEWATRHKSFNKTKTKIKTKTKTKTN